MSITATLQAVFGVAEQIAIGADAYTNPTVAHAIAGVATATELKASSTPPVTKVWSDKITLSAGAASIDLTALTYPTERDNVDLTGLGVRGVIIFAAAGNTGPVKVAGAASNPYELFGDAATEIDVGAGQAWVWFDTSAENLPDVSGTVKSVAFSSSDASAIFDIIVIAG